MILVLLVLASAGASVTQLDATKFRASISFEAKGPRSHAGAQLALSRAAQKACSGKGVAVSDGSLTLDNAQPAKSKSRMLTLSEVYSCRPAD